MTCESCLHNEACKLHNARWLMYDKETERLIPHTAADELCKAYKSKERFVELPCKKETPLYIIEPRFYNYEKHEGVQQGICKSYAFDDVFGLEVVVALEYGEPHTLYYYNASKFGKTIFLTREEAKAALRKEEEE